MNCASGLVLRFDRQMMAAIGEGAAFLEQAERLAGSCAELKCQTAVVRETGDLDDRECLTVSPMSTVLRMG